MSLIVTHISHFGVIQLSDSALTRGVAPNRLDAGDADKLFDIPQLSAALAVAGSYAVGHTRLHEWLEAFIMQNGGVPSLQAFSEQLCQALSNEVSGDQGHVIHIVGYGRDPQAGALPEFWFVRNFAGIEETTGHYLNRQDNYAVSEDFLTRDLPGVGGWSTIQAGGEWIYVNGLAYGRMAFNSAFHGLAGMDAMVITNSGGGLRAPNSIDEMSHRVQQRFELVSDVFSRNTFGARVIGGPTQIRRLPIP